MNEKTDINHNEGKSLLMQVLIYNQPINILKLLMNEKTDINQKDNQGNVILF